VGWTVDWVLARVGLDELPPSTRRNHVLRAFALVAALAAVSGCVGVLLGAAMAHGSDLSEWKRWQEDSGIRDLRAFVIVASLQAASNLGGLLGLWCAIGYVRRRGASR